MRARSAYLMTSWWVVGIWIGLTLLTGIVSVISVTQPTWYVRYTLVHAQALQEVAFQVVVSSVGPLGFCRVVSVERHPVIDYTSVVEENELSTPEDNHLPTPAITIPPIDASFKSPASTAATESSTGASQVTITAGADGNSKSTKPSAALKGFTTEGGGGDDGSFLEWPPTSYTNFGFQHLKTSLEGISSPTAFPGLDLPDFAAEEERDERLESTRPVTSTPMSPFEMYTGAYDGTVTIESDGGIREVLFKVTEEYVNVLNKDQDESLVKGPVAVHENSMNFPQEEKETRDSGTDNSITTERSTTPVEQNAIDTGDHPVRNGGIYFKENGTEVEEFLPNKQEYDNEASYRRKKKKKKKRRNKKKQKKRARNQTRKEYKNHQDVSLEKKHDIIVTTPMTDLAEETSVNKSGAINIDEGNLGDEIRAEFLVQQPQNSLEKNAIGLDYKPRRPILACSGVVIGVRSGSSAVWVLVGVVYGVAGVVQVLVGLFSILSQVVKSPGGRYAHAIWMGNVQVAVVMSQGVTLVLFPLGLGSPLARVECGGSSSVYWSGDCSFGWGYMLAIVSTTLAAYCPCLARLTVYKKYALREWESLNFF
ncbi:uncharacterized protein LOC135219494 [Macrobrachium nipponense]|uniref:uncharacterized protein LOC135219494 n=1 Tax=Macrobrachium nipponense TaxID=159736 RepID=UPI0030C82FD3